VSKVEMIAVGPLLPRALIAPTPYPLPRLETVHSFQILSPGEGEELRKGLVSSFAGHKPLTGQPLRMQRRNTFPAEGAD